MDKQALLGTGLKTAVTAAKNAFMTGGKNAKLGARIGRGVDGLASSMAKTHGYAGNAGGLLKRTAAGSVSGLSTIGKVIGGMGVAGAAGYAAG